MPPFQENEIDKYFAHFEKVADRKLGTIIEECPGR